MACVRLIHWRAAEASALVKALRSHGHRVIYSERFDSAALRKSLPDAFVIDLSRLPSHGREVAIFLRGHKATRLIPIVFAGGDPNKVEAIRKLLPDATYTAIAGLPLALDKAIERAPANPVTPPQMMERYAGRTVAQKLGIGENSAGAVIDPPRDYSALVGDLPPGARLEEEPAQPLPVTLWFVHEPAGFLEGLPRMRRLAGNSKLWLLWRKGGVIKQQFVRESAAAAGLVDYKVCALGGDWSAMLFARRRER